VISYSIGVSNPSQERERLDEGGDYSANTSTDRSVLCTHATHTVNRATKSSHIFLIVVYHLYVLQILISLIVLSPVVDHDLPISSQSINLIFRENETSQMQSLFSKSTLRKGSKGTKPFISEPKSITTQHGGAGANVQLGIIIDQQHGLGEFGALKGGHR
jgi:hypothetical protein